MVEVFGNYIEHDETEEYLILSFCTEKLSIRERWRNNSLSADFLASYWGTFFPVDDKAAQHLHKELKDAVSFIANELLENAVKYSVSDARRPIRIGLYLSEHLLRFYIANPIDLERKNRLQDVIKTLLTGNPDELYLAQIEANASGQSSGSGLGYLIMLTNYHVNLAWKFTQDDKKPDMFFVTTMVEVEIERK